jgi:hypothetical protein
MAMAPVLPSPTNTEAVWVSRLSQEGGTRVKMRDGKKGNCIDQMERIGSSEASGLGRVW